MTRLPTPEPPLLRPFRWKIVGGVMALMIGIPLLILQGIRHASTTIPVRFTVAKGASAREIAHQLSNEHLVWHPWSFLLWTRIPGTKAAIRPGIYTLTASQTGREIFREFQKGPPLVRVTFPEGWTAAQMAAHLESKGITSAQEFLALSQLNKREGFLFPDTYFFEQGLPAEKVIARLVDRFQQKRPADFGAQARLLKLSEAQLVTLASIVEREAQAAQERPLIAGVFYNRLKKHMYLESCATVEYALGDWKPRLTYKDLQIVSPYNTYRHAGLPPGPICNPGAAALEAASHPAKTDMLFFVADGKGTHQFSRYYKEHLAVQKKKK